MQIENIGHRLCMQGYRVLMRTRKGGGMSSNCLTNISHQFLVVVGANLAQEIIVEVSFKSHFVMCKPPESYMEVLSKLPDVFVGTKTMLDRVASKVAKEMKGAFAQLGHSTPPWREKGSILSKWNPEVIVCKALEATSTLYSSSCISVVIVQSLLVLSNCSTHQIACTLIHIPDYCGSLCSLCTTTIIKQTLQHLYN